MGVEQLYRLDQLAAFKTSVKVGSVSSYDRSGGNDDGFSGKYSFIRKEGDTLVIADLKKKAWGTNPTPCRRNFGLVAPAVFTAPVGTMPVETVSATAAIGAGAAFFPRTGFIHRQSSAIELGSIEGLNGLLRLFGRVHRDESKAAGTASNTIRHEVGFGDHAMRREGVLQVVFGGVEREVPNE